MSVDQQQPSMTTPSEEAEQAEAYDDEELQDEGFAEGHRFLFFNAVPSWLVSMVVHVVIVLTMALIPVRASMERRSTMITAAPPGEEIEEIEEFEEPLLEPIDLADADLSDVIPIESLTVVESIPQEVTEVGVADDLDSAAVSVDFVDFSGETAPRNDLMQEIGSLTGSGLDGRGSAAARQALVRSAGGSEGSEKAVAAALKWLAAVQLPDGGWNFDHRLAPREPQRSADHAGDLRDARNGATAMALLPFLGAGQTHIEGDYQQVVHAGLTYLITHMKPDGSMHENGGRMYAHGLAAITLCEAYGMTHDKVLMRPAQASLNFIAYAQDPIGGGWRYKPREPGDTSVVGWQLMALKSGHMAYLQVSPNTIRGAVRFLDTVQANSGAYYGYMTPAKRVTTTSVGLLCRMYLGWGREHPALKDGVEYLSQQGPSNNNMYHNYYATQVMRQFGDVYWDKWNNKMRDFLVNKQNKQGPAAGSWYFDGGHGADKGGRLYNTSLATMILEVYYRHMPIYQDQATTDDFPL